MVGIKPEARGARATARPGSVCRQYVRRPLFGFGFDSLLLSFFPSAASCDRRREVTLRGQGQPSISLHGKECIPTGLTIYTLSAFTIYSSYLVGHPPWPCMFTARFGGRRNSHPGKTPIRPRCSSSHHAARLCWQSVQLWLLCGATVASLHRPRAILSRTTHGRSDRRRRFRSGTLTAHLHKASDGFCAQYTAAWWGEKRRCERRDRRQLADPLGEQ